MPVDFVEDFFRELRHAFFCVENGNTHIHSVFQGILAEKMWMKRYLSTSFPQFVDNVM